MPRGDDLDQLISRAQGGDVRAFETLLASHLGLVRRFARAFARHEADADDLAQEALLKVYRSIKLFRYQSAFSSWLYAVVRNVFLDAVRSRRGRESELEEALEDGHTKDLAGADTPHEALARSQERDRLWAALRQVPEEFRTALVLFDIEGCSYDELAAVENVPVGTVKSRLSRGRAHLRRLLGEQETSGAAESSPAAGTSSAAAPSNPSRRGS